MGGICLDFTIRCSIRWESDRLEVGSDRRGRRGVDLLGENGCENGCEVEILSRCAGETA